MLKEILEKIQEMIENIDKQIASVDNAIKKAERLQNELINKQIETNNEIIRLLNIIIDKMDGNTNVSVNYETNTDTESVINETPTYEEPKVQTENPVNTEQDLISSFFSSFTNGEDMKTSSTTKVHKVEDDKPMNDFDKIMSRLNNSNAVESMNKVNLGGSSFDSIFKTSLDNNKPQEEPKIYTVPPRPEPKIVTPNIQTPYRELEFRFNKQTHVLTLMCHNDNSTMNFAPDSEAFNMIVNKLKTEGRKLSSLTDAEILEFLRTVLTREKEYGVNLRGYGIPYGSQTIHPVTAGFGYDINDTFSSSPYFYS